MNTFQINEYNTIMAYENIKSQFHKKETTGVLQKRFKQISYNTINFFFKYTGFHFKFCNDKNKILMDNCL